jgi:transposase-like protein
MPRGARRHSARTKFKVVLELLEGSRSIAQIARSHGVHPNTILNWKQTLLEHGPSVFETRSNGSECERRIGDLERLLGKKEVEIALLKNFLGRET